METKYPIQESFRFDGYNPLTDDLELWCKLNDFVKTTCQNRDESHGHTHMQTVAITSMLICLSYKSYQTSFTSFHQLCKRAMIVAWLHDINDHKYVQHWNNGTNFQTLVHDFLLQLLQEEKETILIENIIDRISYSKENKTILNKEKSDWLEILGVEGCLVRDIVSDADKLEALGRIGLTRCVEFIKHKHNNSISQELLKEKVNEHAKEKLLRLKDEFMRTTMGRYMAEHRHNEFVLALEEFNQS
jgi:HD superfamily phosphodiesterase